MLSSICYLAANAEWIPLGILCMFIDCLFIHSMDRSFNQLSLLPQSVDVSLL